MTDKTHGKAYLRSFKYRYGSTDLHISILKNIPVNSNLTVSVVPNLLSTLYTKSDRPNFVISPTQSLKRGAFSIRGKLINPQIGRLPLSDLVNREVSLF